MKLVELKLWLAWVEYGSFDMVPVYLMTPLSVTFHPSSPKREFVAWLYKSLCRENGDSSFSEVLSASQSISVPFSLVCLNLISCYVFKLFLYIIGFVASHGQVERKLPLAELYCNHFFKKTFSQDWLYTGLVKNFLTLCCETTMVNLHWRLLQRHLKVECYLWFDFLLSEYIKPNFHPFILFSLLYKKYRIFCPSYFVIKLEHV